MWVSFSNYPTHHARLFRLLLSCLHWDTQIINAEGHLPIRVCSRAAGCFFPWSDVSVSCTISSSWQNWTQHTNAALTLWYSTAPLFLLKKVQNEEEEEFQLVHEWIFVSKLQLCLLRVLYSRQKIKPLPIPHMTLWPYLILYNWAPPVPLKATEATNSQPLPLQI